MIVSNTEVTSIALCERQHHYRFILGIEPRRLSRALTRGIIGHEALEAYYSAMKEGYPLERCAAVMLAVIDRHITTSMIEQPEEFEHVNMLHELRKLLIGYAEFYRQEPFKIHAIEKVFTASIDAEQGIDYGMKLDLLVEFTKGEYRGDFAVFDHKFVYNFKSPAEVDMDAQLPKYIKTVRDSGIYVSKGFFNQIRTRPMTNPLPNQLFRRTPLKSKSVKTEQIWDEQKEFAQEIVKVKADETYKPKRTLSLLVCRSCLFQPLCHAELMGEDITERVKVDYQKNTYGYSDLVGDD